MISRYLRFAFIALIALMVLSITSCVPTSSQPTAVVEVSPSPPPPTETQLPPTQTPLPPTETPAPTKTPEPTATLDPAIFELRSPAFGSEESIPGIYTCKGDDISPPLEWGDPPENTISLVLLVEDITASNLVHWILFNIPPETRSLPRAVPTTGHFNDGRQQGRNQILKLGYFGPCPMPGPNQYRFRLYALDVTLDLEDGVMKIPMKEAMKGHILAETEVIGVYP